MNGTDIATLDKYRGRVQELEYPPDPNFGIDVLQALSLCYPGPVFPNLQVLEWWCSDDSFFPFIRSCLSSKLTSLTISAGAWAPTAISFMLRLPTHICPNILRHLHIQFRLDSRDSQLQLCGTNLGIWHSLHYLHLSGLTVEGFLQVAKMPHLEKLTLDTEDRLHALDPNCLKHISHPFPRLRSFTSHDFPFRVVKLLPCIPLSQLEELALESSSSASVTQQEWISCIHILAQRLNRKIFKKLYINYDNIDVPQQWLDIILSPLLQLSALENVEIDLCGDLGLSDAYATRIAQAWPEITVLDILPSFIVADSPLTALSALVALASGCPKLRRLGVAFDAANEEVQATLLDLLMTSKLGSPHLSLECLRVGYSPIVHKEFVALLLFELFPNLAYIEASGEDEETKDRV